MKQGDKKYLFFVVFLLPLALWFIFLNFLFFEITIFNSGLSSGELTLLVFAVITTVLAIIIYSSILNHWHKKEKELQNAIINTDIKQIDSLSPFEFEEWVARFLRASGYIANTTKKSGDYGVDVIAEKDGNRIAIQVKKYSKAVGIKAVQEVISGMAYYNCYEGWVISSAPYFTQAANKLADARNIKLYSKNDLALLLYHLQQDKKLKSEINEKEDEVATTL